MVQQLSALSRFLLLGRGPGGTAASAGRFARIDVIRGLALLIIFINHMPGNVIAAWMPHNFGFSDGADAFVLLAGVSATLAYGNLIERQGLTVGALKIGARLWTLYIAHLALFIVVCGVVAAAVTAGMSLFMRVPPVSAARVLAAGAVMHQVSPAFR